MGLMQPVFDDHCLFKENTKKCGSRTLSSSLNLGFMQPEFDKDCLCENPRLEKLYLDYTIYTKAETCTTSLF